MLIFGFNEKGNFFKVLQLTIRTTVVLGHKRVTVNATGSISTRENEIFIIFYISSLWCRSKARR